MKNFQYKGKVFFWSGVIMLVVAGGVWAASGGIGRVLRAYADAQNGTCIGAGCYSEEWKADEVLGDVSGFDYGGTAVKMVTKRYGIRVTRAGGGVTNLLSDASVDDAFSGQTFEYFAVPGSGASIVQNGGDNVRSNNGALLEYGPNGSNTPVVVSWTVNGHVH